MDLLKEKTQVLQHAADGTTINLSPKTNYGIYSKVIIMKNKINTDKMGKFPVTSKRGENTY